MSDNWIRAHEISEYVYCNRAWWMKRVGKVRSANVKALERGTAYHEEHGKQIQLGLLARYVALLFVLMACALVFVTLLPVG